VEAFMPEEPALRGEGGRKGSTDGIRQLFGLLSTREKRKNRTIPLIRLMGMVAGCKLEIESACDV
jgi:hypothetical protein